MTPLPHHPSVAGQGILHGCTCGHLKIDHVVTATGDDECWKCPCQQFTERSSDLIDLAAAERAVVDAAVAETVAEQNAVRHATCALDAPNRSPALTTAGDAVRAATAARAARRDAVQRLLQHRQDHE